MLDLPEGGSQRTRVIRAQDGPERLIRTRLLSQGARHGSSQGWLKLNKGSGGQSIKKHGEAHSGSDSGRSNREGIV